MVRVGYLGPLENFNTGPLVFSRKALAVKYRFVIDLASLNNAA
jgi:hypothetical protein